MDTTTYLFVTIKNVVAVSGLALIIEPNNERPKGKLSEDYGLVYY